MRDGGSKVGSGVKSNSNPAVEDPVDVKCEGRLSSQLQTKPPSLGRPRTTSSNIYPRVLAEKSAHKETETYGELNLQSFLMSNLGDRRAAARSSKGDHDPIDYTNT